MPLFASKSAINSAIVARLSTKAVYEIIYQIENYFHFVIFHFEKYFPNRTMFLLDELVTGEGPVKYETTIRTLEKQGFSVRRDIRDSKMNPGTQYEAGFFARLPNGKRTIEASKQDDVVISMRVIRDGDKDDSQSDYFAGTWVYTVKRAIELACLER